MENLAANRYINLSSFICVAQNEFYSMTSFVNDIIYNLKTFVSNIIIKERPLRITGILC
jgi:hypothetical protein